MRHKTSPVKLWGPLVLTALLSLNSYTASADDNVSTIQDTTQQASPGSTSLEEGNTNELSGDSMPSDTPSSETNISEESASQPLYPFAQPLSRQKQEGTLSTVQPQGLESNAIINVQPIWDENYKGQGTVVAVIDSGLDIEHDVLRLTDKESAKYKSAEEIEAKKAEAGITYGKWYSDKVVFGYNYTDVNEELKEAKEDSHGMHVSGIAVGNPSKEDSSGSYIYGVAPEAQLMFMRVFSDSRGRGTQPLLYARAIEDAVKLGADAINLSLGGANGSTIDVGDHIDRAIAFARSKGVAVVIAAGNDTVFGNGKELPYANNPDYGVVGSPSTARDSISVASYNNTHLTREVANISGMEDNEALNGGKFSFTKASNSRSNFPADVAYDYVYVNLGSEEDFKDLDLTGKLALIKRGELTFEVKMRNAKAAGAAGAVIFDHSPNTPDNFSMSVSDGALATFPAAFIPLAFGEELVAKSGQDTYKIQFAQKYETIANKDAGKMSDFTSWGVTVDGELKPDVTAPGGSIYSAINNGKYNVQSGTSMASPHVAGVVALMKQVLVEKFPNLSPAELQTRIKQLLMSTAVPHINPDTQTYTSPRQQGAGIVDTTAAIHSDVYLTGEDELTNVALGNVGDTLEFSVRLHNTSDQARTFKYVADLNTDEVAEGRFTLKPRHLTQVSGEVTVEANSSVLVPISLDATEFSEELSHLMSNGYFLEGFVRFLTKDDEAHVVSIPFVGFRGDFKALPVLEKPVYDFDFNNGEIPFYMTRPEDAIKDQLNPNSDNEYYTVLMTSTSEWDHTKGARTPETPAILGSYKDKEGRDILYRDENGKVQLILSPNGDNNRDAIIFAGVFLRNFDKLKIAVYKADDLDRANPVWESPIQSGDKNFWAGSDDNDRATVFPDAVWDGKDKFKNYVPDGDYKYVVTYYPQVPGAKPQETVFDLLVDTVQPALTTGVMDRQARTFKPRPTLPYGRTPLYREGVYYVLPFEELSEEDMELDTGNGNGKRFYIEPDEDGVYHLPETDYNGKELGISSFYFFAENYGGNTISTNLSEYQESENYSAVVGIRLRDPLTDEFVPLDFRYVIRNEQGEIVTDEKPIDGPNGNLYSLPFGTYSVELILIDEDGAYLVDERVKTFTVTEENSLHPVTFDVTPLQRTPFTIDFDTEPPVGTKVYLVDSKGNRTLLPQARYSKDIFEKKLLPGDYTVQIELPAGLHATENNFGYTIATDATNLKELSLWAKGDIEDNGGADETAEELPSFDLEADSDGDGYANQDELTAGSNPFDATSIPVTAKGEEGNGEATSEEQPEFKFEDDHDGDGFSNEEELTLGTDPTDKADFPQTAKGDATTEEQPEFKFEDDHDGDSFSTEEEMTAGTNPFDSNSFPIKEKKINANLINDDKPNFDVDGDEDKDSFSSKDELNLGTNPLDKSDFPQTANGGATTEVKPEFKFEDDHDGDSFSTEEEMTAGTNPFDNNSFPIKEEKINANLINDDKPNFNVDGDEDMDGFSNKDELNLGTNPLDKSDFPQTAKGDQDKHGAAETAEPLPVFVPAPQKDKKTAQEIKTAPTAPAAASQQASSPAKAAKKELPATGDRTSILTLTGVLMSSALLFKLARRHKD